jgi:hypothetical protein
MLQTVAGVAFCPIDIVKQRVQTHAVLHPGGSTFGPLAAMREVYAAAGVPGVCCFGCVVLRPSTFTCWRSSFVWHLMRLLG